MDRCNKCGEFIFTTIDWRLHFCAPVWSVWNTEDDEIEASNIYAMDAEDAAAKWAEEYDEDDHEMARGDEVCVYVKSSDGELTKWNVSADITISYHASEKELTEEEIS